MKKALGYLQKIQIAVGGIFLCIFLGSVVVQMACRYAGIAAIWTEDVSMYAFIWAAFMGLRPWSMKNSISHLHRSATS